jgi:hypothetical protein
MIQFKSFLLLFLITSIVQGQSSNPFMSDANGKPLYLRTTYTAEGSPYFYDDYCFAELTGANGKIYSDVKVKLDLTDRSVIYLTESGDEMMATTPITRIKFMSFIYNGTAYGETVLQGFPTALNAADGKVYQVLEDGKTKLLKELEVTYTDNKRYGEATITRVFKRKETCFALLENTTDLKKVEKNKTAVVALFERKQQQVSNYIETQKLKCKNEQDLIQVFRYYNSL